MGGLFRPDGGIFGVRVFSNLLSLASLTLSLSLLLDGGGFLPDGIAATLWFVYDDAVTGVDDRAGTAREDDAIKL